MESRDTHAFLGLLGKAAHSMSQALHEPEVIRILLDEVVEGFGARAALIRIVSADGTELLLAGAKGLSEGYLAKGPVKILESAIDQRVLAGEVVTIPNVADEPGFQYPTDAAGEGLRAMVAVPFSVRDRIIGVFRVYLESLEGFSEANLALLTLFADLGALAAEKLRLHQSLYTIAEALNSSLELQPMLHCVLEAAVGKMRLKGALIRLWDNRDQLLYLAASCGLSAAYLKKGAVDLGHSPVDQRALKGETVVIYDVLSEPGMQHPEEAVREGIRSVLTVPLKLKERTFGVMRVFSALPRHYGPIDISFLTSVAGLVALAIENAELYQALRSRYENLKTDLADWYQFLALG